MLKSRCFEDFGSEEAQQWSFSGLMTLISTTDEERRVDERDELKKSLRLKYVDVEVKWSCRGLYPSKGPEGLSGWVMVEGKVGGQRDQGLRLVETFLTT